MTFKALLANKADGKISTGVGRDQGEVMRRDPEGRVGAVHVA